MLLQILFARMGITVLLASAYMWYAAIPDFPLGQREVRLLLVARGLGGFFGVFGMYCKLLEFRNIPLACADTAPNRLIDVSSPCRCNCHHLPGTQYCLLGVLISHKRALHKDGTNCSNDFPLWGGFDRKTHLALPYWLGYFTTSQWSGRYRPTGKWHTCGVWGKIQL
jgi:hypothetical protein